MGKGRRSRKQMAPIEKDDGANVEDVNSDGRDDSYEAELTDDSSNDDEYTDSDTDSTGAAAAKKPNKRRAHDATKVTLMEGEGKSLRVRGFNQRERAAFLKILKRFGAGEYDWAEFVPRLKPKTKKEIHKYGVIFLEHLVEPINDSPTFKDGVPKEGLRVEDLLVRMATMTNIRDKVKASTGGSVHFADDIMARHPQLREGKYWKQSHDLILLQAVLKHGYGRWQAIAEDKDLGIHDVICQQLLIPVPGTTRPRNSSIGTSQAAQPSTFGIPQTHNSGNETVIDHCATGSSTDTAAQAQLSQDYKMWQNLREVQRRQVEFIKKRVLLLARGLNAQLAKTFYGDGQQQTYNMPNAETGHKVEDFGHPIPEGFYAEIINQLPQAEPISSADISAVASDTNPDHLKTASLYYEMNKVVIDNPQDSIKACVTNKPPSFNLGSNLAAMEVINQEISQILSPAQHSSLPATSTEGQKAQVENSSFANNFVFEASVGTDVGSSAMERKLPLKKRQQMYKRRSGLVPNIDASNDGGVNF